MPTAIHISFTMQIVSLLVKLQTGGQDIIVFKLDSSGNVLWIRQQPSFNTTGNDMDPSITVDLNGNSYVAYSTNKYASGQSKTGTSDIVVFKLDTDGNTLWVKQNNSFNTTLANTHPSISADPNGNVYISYQTPGTVSGQTNTGGSDIVTFKLDTNGNTQWVRENPNFNTTVSDSFTDGMHRNIIADASGNSYTVYFTQGRASGQTDTGVDDIVVYKIDTNGNIMWVRQNGTFNSTSNGLNPSISLDGSGNIYVAYQSSGAASGQTFTGVYDIVVFKMDPNGNTLWVKEQPTFNTTDEDSIPSIATDN